MNVTFARKDFLTGPLILPKGAPFTYYSYYKRPQALKNRSSQGRKRNGEIKKKVHFTKKWYQGTLYLWKDQRNQVILTSGQCPPLFRPSPATGTDCKVKKYYDKKNYLGSVGRISANMSTGIGETVIQSFWGSHPISQETEGKVLNFPLWSSIAFCPFDGTKFKESKRADDTH